MELSVLTVYCEEKYHIHEEYKWVRAPGLSVLTHPDTGKWIALLIRKKDGEFCDIRCTNRILSPDAPDYLSAPFIMKGDEWAGVRF